MAWKDTLLDASFRGITFDVVSSPFEGSHSLSKHSYPYASGADFEDMGTDARSFSMEIVIDGDDYEIKLKSLLKALDESGEGELVHPVFGSIVAMVASYQVNHEADHVDGCQITARFVQHTVASGLFEKTRPIQKVEAISQTINAARESAKKVLLNEVAQVKSAGLFSRVEQFRGNMMAVLSQWSQKASSVITSGLDVFNYPTSWATDVASLVGGIVDLRGFDVATLGASWRAAFSDLSEPILFPAQLGNTPRTPARDLRVVQHYVGLEQALGKADAARLVLLSEADTPSLSLNEIESLVADARTTLESSIDDYRADYAMEYSRPVVESLKSVAFNVQDAANLVINARPPLVKKAVEGLVNYRLQAHFWYGDHTRAPELARLNANLRTPNLIYKGEVLNAFAK